MLEKRWTLLPFNDVAVESLRQELRISPVLCRILTQRGIDSFQSAKAFFNPALSDLHDPYLMKDMDKAVSRIMHAFRNKEKILVYGDYDVDGTTSVACMYQFLREFYTGSDFYIPHRYREGYGVSRQGIDYAYENGFTLIISLDCGIKSVDLVSYAKSLGIDFIICDHHMPDQILPEAAAILNPKQVDCSYPYKELCGCGVGFKLITALSKAMELPAETPYQFLDLVATAIAADIVPITGENRILAFHGLIKANNNPNYGIKALAHLSKFAKTISVTNLVFLIAPRVNAAGRMDDARKAVQMFVSNSYPEALVWAEQLHTDNDTRKEADLNITREALTLIETNELMKSRWSTVLYQPHWHKGVVGIVASRLIDHYYRPTIILTNSGDYVAGSARSISGFNVYEAVHECRDLLLGYGGHFYAAGMTLSAENVDAFCSRFEEVVQRTLAPELMNPEIVIDAEVELRDLTPSFNRTMCRMEPFGPENLKPVLLARGVINGGYSRIVKDQHIRFDLRQGSNRMSGIGFNLAAKFHLLQEDAPIDVVFRLEENEWNGQTSLQMHVIDLRAGTQV